MVNGGTSFSVFAVFFPAIVFVGILQLLQHSDAATAADHETRLLQAAESGLESQSRLLLADPLWAVKDRGTFRFDAVAMEYVSAEPGAPRLHVRYSRRGSPVVFADRSSPVEPWDAVKVTAIASEAGMERRAVACYEMEIRDALAGAVVCTSGDVTFANGGRMHLFGDVHAGRRIRERDADAPLDIHSARRVFDSFSGALSMGTAHAPDEDDVAEELFDFDRFEAAAAAGGGQVFDGLVAFARACNDANASGRALEGILVVRLDPRRDGHHPRLAGIPGGIHVRGTLIFRFATDSDANRITIESDINVNAADLSNWRSEDATTYSTGFPPTFADPTKAPWNRSIAPFEPFTSRDGLPAVMVDSGSLGIRSAANICGVVFASARLHVASPDDRILFFHGSLLAREGIGIENGSGVVAICFDPDALAQLQTRDDVGKQLKRTGFAILR